MKSFLKTLGVMLGGIVAGSVIAYLLLMLVYLIPVDGRMKRHLVDADATFYREMNGVQITKGYSGLTDSYTDALMLLTASQPSCGNLAEDVATVRYKTSNEAAFETIHKIAEGKGKMLRDDTYAVYWHGYLLFLKPLFWAMVYTNIRTCMIAFVVLMVAAILLKLKGKHDALILPMLLLFLFVNPPIVMTNMQNFTIYALTLVMILLLLFLDDKKLSMEKYCYLFCALGCLTSFFDFLTYPVLTVGVSVAVWWYLHRQQNFIKDFISCMKLSLSWSLGYAMFWAMNWIISSAVWHKNVVEAALQEARIRSLSETEGVSTTLTEAYRLMIDASLQPTWVLMLSVIIVAGIFMGIRYKNVEWKQNMILWVIALYPFVWYAVVRNHSTFHRFFTQRTLGVTVFALCLFFSDLLFQKRRN
jgi:hypothetical protein